MNKIKSLFINQSGQSMVLVALILTGLLCFAALAIDVGNLYLEKSKLQKALDSAVLAGAQSLKDNSVEEVESVAAEFSQLNGYPLAPEEVHASIETHDIWAKKIVKVDMYFAKFLGINEVDVPAYAKAVLRPIKSMSGLTPIGVLKGDYKSGEMVTLTFPDMDPGPGNVGWVDFDGSGGGEQELLERIRDGYNETVEIGPPNGKTGVYTQTGKSPKRYDELLKRISDDTNDPEKTYCDDPLTADSECRRLIYVPIIEQWGAGDTPLTVVGFAKFLLSDEGMETNEFKGQFINYVLPGDITNETSEEYYFGLYGVKLFK